MKNNTDLANQKYFSNEVLSKAFLRKVSKFDHPKIRGQAISPTFAP